MTFGDASGYAGAFVVALVASAVAAWPIYLLLLRIKSRQTVSQFLGETHQKKQGTPTMGGLIVLPGFVLVGLERSDWYMTTLYLGFAAIGFLDDFLVPRLLPGKRGLGWVPKLALEVAVVAGCLAPAGLLGRSGLVVAFVVLFCANAYNFADGLDGLAGGLLLLLAPALLLLGADFDSTSGIAMCAALCGAVIPFLFLNCPPARLFMGDVGSLPIGAVLGMVIARLHYGWGRLQPAGTGHGRGELDLALLLLSLVLIAELVPVPLQILSVKLRKGKRLFPRTPIHHTFELWSWPESRITWTFLLAQFICSAGAICAAVFGGWLR